MKYLSILISLFIMINVSELKAELLQLYLVEMYGCSVAVEINVITV